MKASPLRIFFGLAITFMVFSYLIDILRTEYVKQSIAFSSRSPELEIARHYVRTGQFEKALEEYKSLAANSNPVVADAALRELNSLTSYEKDGWTYFRQIYLVYTLWFFSRNLYTVSFILIIIWSVFFVANFIWKKPELVIQPIIDYTDENLGETAPRLATDRLKGIINRIEKLNNNPSIISEVLDVPVISMITDGSLVDFTTILETTLILSNESIRGLPLQQIMNSMRMWIEQPKYMLRGHLRRSGNSFVLSLTLVKGKGGEIVNEWSIRIEQDQNTDVILNLADSLIFPLLFHFGNHMLARRWEAFRELQRGLDEFATYEATGFEISNLHNAITHMEQALEFDPDYELASYNLGLLLLQIGNYERARELLRKISMTSLDLRVRQYSSYGYSVALLHTNQIWALERAVATLKNLVVEVTDGEFSNLATSTLAVVYSRLAELGGEKEAHARLALAESQKIKQSQTTSDPIIANAFVADGFSYLVLGNLQEAISSFQNAIKRDTKNIAGSLGLGISYIRIGNEEKAINEFRKAEKISPLNSYSSYKLGNLYRELGDKENAINAFKRAGAFALAYLMLGKYYLDDQEYDQALTEFRQATSLNKRLGEAWQNIAWTICESETEANDLLYEAEDSARRAVELEKNGNQSWHRHATLSRVLLARGKTKSALQKAEIAVSLAPKRAQTHYCLAQAQYASELFGDSRKHAQMVIELDTDDGEWRAKAKELIDQILNKKKK